MNWLIIADDLSGAADCAIGFAAHGARTVVTLNADTVADIAHADVIAADADSRRMAPQDAAACNLDVWRRADGQERRLYKKIDSTLRGNWAAETAALQPAAGLAIVAPAFPATGRTTQDGRMFVHGQPLEDTDIWRVEKLRGPADMVDLLAAQGLRTVRMPLQTLRAGAAATRSQLAAWIDAGFHAVVCDAGIEQDLLTLAAASLALDAAHFCVGSGGLARALSMAAPQPAQAPAGGVTHRTGPVLALVGSMSGISGRQTAYLCERTAIDCLSVAPQVLRNGVAHADWHATQQSIGATLRAGRDMLVSIGRDDAFALEDLPDLAVDDEAGRIVENENIGRSAAPGAEPCPLRDHALGKRGGILAAHHLIEPTD